jgi:hypothetical protein
MAEEMREHEIRRRNVVIHRVGEAGPEVESVEERKAWDLKSCNNIFRALDLEMDSESAVKFVRRVGERGEAPRPLVVGLKKEWQKEDLMEKAKHLKDTNFRDVMIVPDLTKEQRKEEAAMNSEAEKRNENLSEEDRAKNLQWMVGNGKDPGSGKKSSPIPDPWGKNALDPGSARLESIENNVF